MTDMLIDRADSGEIPRIDDLGEGPTEDLRQHLRRDTREELTQNLAHEIAGLPPRRRPESDPAIETRIVEHPLLNTWDMVETVIYLPTVADSLAGASATVAGELEGPQKPPPPLPPVPTPKLRRSVPLAAMVERSEPDLLGRLRYRGARRKPEERRLSPWWGLAIAVGFGVAAYVGLAVAAMAVIR